LDMININRRDGNFWVPELKRI